MNASTLAPLAEAPPIFGHIIDFRRDILAATRVGWQKHGGLVRYRLGPIVVHCLSDPESAFEVFTKPTIYGKLGPDNPLRLVLGEGLLTSSDHDSWMRNRRMMQPAYSKESIAAMFDSMVACAEAMIEELDANHRAGDIVDIHKVLMRVTLDIVSRCMFGVNLADVGEVAGPQVVEHALEFAFTRLQNPYSPPVGWPTPRNRRFTRMVSSFDTYIYDLIQERRATGIRRDDFLDMLLAARDADTGAAMTDLQLRDEIVTTFAAGHETTAQTLTWAMLLLSRNPAVARDLEDEVDAVLGGRMPTPQDLSKLPLTTQVFSEALRLYPSAPLIPRLVSQDTRLGRFDIPAGSRMLVNLVNIGSHPDYWTDPQKFDPSRFDGGKPMNVDRRAYAPFGGGPHLCIGKHFAMMESQIILAALVQHYRFKHLPSHPVVPQASITLRPAGGMRMVMHTR